MPVREVSVTPIHVEGCGLISIRFVDLDANDATRWLHKVSSAWSGVDMFICPPFAVLSACWRRVNILATPAIVGMLLRRVLISLIQCLREHRMAMKGVVLVRGGRLFL